METYDGTIFGINKRSTNIPVTRADIFAATYDNHRAIGIKVLQGEGPMAIDNTLLGGSVCVTEPAPKGESEVEVSYHVDMDGILNVLITYFFQSFCLYE